MLDLQGLELGGNCTPAPKSRLRSYPTCRLFHIPCSHCSGSQRCLGILQCSGATLEPLSVTQSHSWAARGGSGWAWRARLAALVSQTPRGIPRCWISCNPLFALCGGFLSPLCRICIADGFCYAKGKLPSPRDNSRSQSLHSLPLPIPQLFLGLPVSILSALCPTWVQEMQRICNRPLLPPEHERGWPGPIEYSGHLLFKRKALPKAQQMEAELVCTFD